MIWGMYLYSNGFSRGLLHRAANRLLFRGQGRGTAKPGVVFSKAGIVFSKAGIENSKAGIDFSKAEIENMERTTKRKIAFSFIFRSPCTTFATAWRIAKPVLGSCVPAKTRTITHSSIKFYYYGLRN